MSDPLIARFADACGATGPLDLRVDLVGGSVLAEGSVDQPFTLVGRDDACDVTLSDPDVNMRHAWLQVVGGRVFVVDLGSRTGLAWANGATGSGWLDYGSPVRIGPFHLQLRSNASDKPSSFPLGYNPLAADSGVKSRPTVTLEFRNGRRAKDRWTVNRLLTLIGRSPDCKIHLNAEDVAAFHCGIVSTRTGLWVVDLSGRGVVVNGERMRVSPLLQGAELWIGRFLIGCQYQNPASSPGTAPAPRLSTPPSLSKTGRVASTPLPSVDPPTSEDEVELGASPEAGDLPASHIMADAFRQLGPNPSESLSNPIVVSGSGSNPPVVAAPLSSLLTEAQLAPFATDTVALAPLLRQMADLHGRGVAEFHQSHALLKQLFSRVKPDHFAVLKHEMNRIQELTEEIVMLQLEVAKQTLDQTAENQSQQPAAPGVDPRSGPWVPPSMNTPLPVPDSGSGITHAADRLATLQHDRAARWQALLVLFAGM